MPELFKIHCAKKDGKRHVPKPLPPPADKPRLSTCAQGYDRKWQRYREWFLRHNPLCVVCKENNTVTPATEVDHIKPHRGDKKLFWDKNNHQGLCAKCHSRKTAREDGGFGNRRRVNYETQAAS